MTLAARVADLVEYRRSLDLQSIVEIDVPMHDAEFPDNLEALSKEKLRTATILYALYRAKRFGHPNTASAIAGEEATYTKQREHGMKLRSNKS